MSREAVVWPLIIFVGLVSAYDAYFNLLYPVTPQSELNPIANAVLVGCGLPGLIGIKFAGTILVVATLAFLNRKESVVGMASLVGVAACQFAVLLFLLTS